MRIHSLYIIPLLLALASCAGEVTVDPDVPKGHSHVLLSVKAANGSGTAQAWTDTNANEGEMMRQATVVVADKDNIVQRIVHVAPTNSDESEREIIDLGTLPNGTYTFYNFGNMNDGYGNASDTYASFNNHLFTTGQKVPEGVATSTTTATFNHFKLQRTGIPMTNIEQHTLDGGNVTLALQLYRQLAKIRLELTNSTAGNVRIHHATIGNITVNGTPIDFFPTKQGDNVSTEYAVNHWPNGVKPQTADFRCYEAPVDETTKDSVFPTIAQTIKLALPDAYLNESQPDHITGMVPLHLEMDRQTGTDEATGQPLWHRETRHALLQLTDIPRNALVLVPVNLVDYMLELEAFFYPPIAGYPPFSMEKKNEEYYATFHGGGDFQLIPHLYLWTDHDDPNKWFSLYDQNVVVQTTGMKPSLKVTDTDGIFTTQPYIDRTTGEILGTLSGTTGHATVTLTAYLRVNAVETYQYNRTIHVIAVE